MGQSGRRSTERCGTPRSECNSPGYHCPPQHPQGLPRAKAINSNNTTRRTGAIGPKPDHVTVLPHNSSSSGGGRRRTRGRSRRYSHTPTNVINDREPSFLPLTICLASYHARLWPPPPLLDVARSPFQAFLYCKRLPYSRLALYTKTGATRAFHLRKACTRYTPSFYEETQHYVTSINRYIEH